MKLSGTPIGRMTVKTDASGKVRIEPPKKGFIASMKARKAKKTPKYRGGKS
jgi:hypothetical protein